MIEDILAAAVLGILVFGGLAGCIVKYCLHKIGKGKTKNGKGEE